MSTEIKHCINCNHFIQIKDQASHLGRCNLKFLLGGAYYDWLVSGEGEQPPKNQYAAVMRLDGKECGPNAKLFESKE